MNKEQKSNQKTILNVGYCETTSEWLNRIITELADENKNFVDLSVICAQFFKKLNFILSYFKLAYFNEVFKYIFFVLANEILLQNFKVTLLINWNESKFCQSNWN